MYMHYLELKITDISIFIWLWSQPGSLPTYVFGVSRVYFRFWIYNIFEDKKAEVIVLKCYINY